MRPSLRPHSLGRSSFGVTMLETLIVSVIILIAIAGLYRYYASVSATEDAHRDSQNAVAMTNAIIKAYSPMANFTGLTNQSLISDGLVPSGMSSDGSTVIQNAFGGTVTVAGMAGATSGARRSFQMTYTDVPSAQCSGFVSQVSRLVAFTSVKVGNSELIAAGGAPLDRAALSTACSAGARNTVILTYTRQAQGTGTTLTECVVPPTDHQTLNCTPGYSGTTEQERTWACPSFYALPTTSGWVTTSNTCAIICVPDPSSPQTQTGPITSAGLPGCASGDLGSVVYQRTSACAGATGYPAWGAWTQKSNNCQSACIVPAPQEQALSCPTGMSGSDVQHKYATCPAVAPPYTAPVGTPSWGAWVDDGNTCACALPSPSSQLQWDPVLRTLSCGQGMTGNQTFQMQQKRAASCPSSTSGYTWSGWTDTGVTQGLDNSACQATCHPDPTEEWIDQSGSCASGYSGSTTWQELRTRTSVCVGTNPSPTNSNWVSTGQTRNNLSTCSPNGCNVPLNPSARTRSWSTGAASCSGLLPAGGMASGAFQIVSASSQGGTASGSASFQCVAGVVSTSPMAGATCIATTCSIPAGQKFSWKVGSETCDYTTTAPQTVNAGSNVTWHDTVSPTTGIASFGCTLGSTSIGTTPISGATCISAPTCTLPSPNPVVTQTPTSPGCTGGWVGTRSGYETYTKTYSCASGSLTSTTVDNGFTPTVNTCHAPSCGAQPAPASRTAYCAAGQYGYTTQSNAFVANAYPTCWQPGSWTPAGGPGCAACPTTGSVNSDVWQGGFASACPAGQAANGTANTNGATISHQMRTTKTTSYAACPAQTTTAPAGTTTTTGPTWTGATSGYSSSGCSSTCSNRLGQFPLATQTITTYGVCASGQTGTKTYSQLQVAAASCGGQSAYAVDPSYGAFVNSGPAVLVSNTCAISGCPLDGSVVPIDPITGLPVHPSGFGTPPAKDMLPLGRCCPPQCGGGGVGP